MFGIGYYKGQPTDYVLKYTGGAVTREGPGLAFYYLTYKTQIAAVPTTSMDASFIFNEVTSDFQAVAIQGQFTFRIADPKQAATQLNFTIQPRSGQYASNDPERLVQRITNVIQMVTRGEVQRRTLEATLADAQQIAGLAMRQVREGKLLAAQGVELMSVYFLSVRSTPEVAKALEAEYRETLMRKADEAIYARRAAAVEEERKIKENEQNTAIALEEQRQQLIALEGGNAQQEAEFRGKALELEAAYKTRALEQELTAYQTLDARTLLALAMKELGANAERVGNLTITSEILAALLNTTGNGNAG